VHRRPASRTLALLAVGALVAGACTGGGPAGQGGADEPAGGGATADGGGPPEPPASAPSRPSPSATRSALQATGLGNGTLKLGSILPRSGDLAFLAPPQLAGLELAVSEMNKVGGVLGSPVELEGADAGSRQPGVAEAAVTELVSAKADALVGAASSATTLEMQDEVAAAGVVQCSASSRSPSLSRTGDGDTRDLFIRTSPADALQGVVLGQAAAADGNTRVAVIARADGYGQGIADAAEAELSRRGAEVVMRTTYEPGTSELTAKVRAVAAAEPDAVVLAAFQEGSRLLRAMLSAGIGPATVSLYGSDGLRSQQLPSLVRPENAGALEGLTVATPSPEIDQAFLDRLTQANPDLAEVQFAAQAFDCATLLGLATVTAGADEPEQLLDELPPVSRGGAACDSFAACKPMLEAGQDVDYVGASGALDLTDGGEPMRGRYALSRFTADGSLEPRETVVAEVSQLPGR
jgi:branched-chain amino acid transport system substrate-binding protein